MQAVFTTTVQHADEDMPPLYSFGFNDGAAAHSMVILCRPQPVCRDGPACTCVCMHRALSMTMCLRYDICISYSLCPMAYALCPMAHVPWPMSHGLSWPMRYVTFRDFSPYDYADFAKERHLQRGPFIGFDDRWPA